MKAELRARLTAELRQHVGTIATDLRGKMRSDVATRARAKKLHADEQVAEDFDVWTDLLSRRAAVLWVLKSVYVRVLEDRGLLQPGRLLDPEAQQLFEKLAPHLGETAFLRWIYRDLASADGGVPELFSPQPAEVALPSDELSRALIAFWRHRDADTGATWGFADERFEGELMGDLYQELDPVVKERFALCQTPEFVRAFILDRTLTPAIEEFGADTVRLLDPACGSGHFLIDGLKRLVAATGAQHPDWARGDVVAHCLGRVVGIDLNDYACALARTRLVMTAAELAGIAALADAARFHPHVYWADGLEQVEREVRAPSVQYAMFETTVQRPRATFTRSDVRAALNAVLDRGFEAVVANPPYIVESDDARRAYHRERLGKRQRYVSAYKQYHLSSPFTERCLQLARRSGHVGLIVDNQFMKRDYGKPLIEQVLASVDLTALVDTSKAEIPHHGTPTLVMLMVAQPPSAAPVTAVVGIHKEEPGHPPGTGPLWKSLAARKPARNSYVSVHELSRSVLRSHPWTWSGGDDTEIASLLDADSEKLGLLATDIGKLSAFGEDAVFAMSSDCASRLGVAHLARPHILGATVRDWAASESGVVLYPYQGWGGEPIDPSDSAVVNYFSRYRTLLRSRSIFGATLKEHGRAWFEHLEHYGSRIANARAIVYPVLCSHNHFAFTPGGGVVNQSARVIKLPPSATDDDYIFVATILNTSFACFWLKRVLQPRSHASQRHHPDPARAVYDLSASALKSFPIPRSEHLRSRLVSIGRMLHGLSTKRQKLLHSSTMAEALSVATRADALKRLIAQRWRESDEVRERMVALQEECDWVLYAHIGLADESHLFSPGRYPDLRCARGDRPFERIVGRASMVRSRGHVVPLNDAEEAPVDRLPSWAEEIWNRRVDTIGRTERLLQIETPVFKRPWRDTDQNQCERTFRLEKDHRELIDYIAERAEEWAKRRAGVFSTADLAAALLSDRRVLCAAEVVSGRADFNLDAVLGDVITEACVPSHRFHLYTDSGSAKRNAWEATWDLQRLEDADKTTREIPVPPEFSQGSRGKSTDFQRNDYWRVRGQLDLPAERFIAFTEIPGRPASGTLYGWGGWPPLQRLKALLAVDEQLEDAGTPLADRIGLLDSAWRLLPDVARDDAAAAGRLKAELQAIVGPQGPSKEQLEDWRQRFPPPTSRAARARKPKRTERDSDESDESDESDDS